MAPIRFSDLGLEDVRLTHTSRALAAAAGHLAAARTGCDAALVLLLLQAARASDGRCERDRQAGD